MSFVAHKVKDVEQEQEMGYTCPICEGENVYPDPADARFGICPDCGAEDIYI